MPKDNPELRVNGLVVERLKWRKHGDANNIDHAFEILPE
jgi:hypothetical protein